MATTTRPNEEIAVYQPVVSPNQAIEKLDNTDDEIVRTEFVETVYYPYQIVAIDVKIDGFLSHHEEVTEVGIDLVNGREILIDDTPNVKNIKPRENRVIQPSEESIDPVDQAKEYLIQVIQQHHRILEVPELKVKSLNERYRPFHLVQIHLEDGPLLYTVDSISGNLHRVYQHDE